MKSFLNTLDLTIHKRRDTFITGVENISFVNRGPDWVPCVQPSIRCDLQLHVFRLAREAEAFAAGFAWADRDDSSIVIEVINTPRRLALVLIEYRDSDDEALTIVDHRYGKTRKPTVHHAWDDKI
jgi:hypothetical protein